MQQKILCLDTFTTTLKSPWLWGKGWCSRHANVSNMPLARGESCRGSPAVFLHPLLWTYCRLCTRGPAGERPLEALTWRKSGESPEFSACLKAAYDSMFQVIVMVSDEDDYSFNVPCFAFNAFWWLWVTKEIHPQPHSFRTNVICAKTSTIVINTTFSPHITTLQEDKHNRIIHRPHTDISMVIEQDV